jgi:hypothetical protein
MTLALESPVGAIAINAKESGYGNNITQLFHQRPIQTADAVIKPCMAENAPTNSRTMIVVGARRIIFGQQERESGTPASIAKVYTTLGVPRA